MANIILKNNLSGAMTPKQSLSGSLSMGVVSVVDPNMAGDYSKLENKPSINGVELSGNVTLEDLGFIGHGLKYDDKTNKLAVDMAENVEKDNTLPISSASVYATVGNIQELLKTI